MDTGAQAQQGADGRTRGNAGSPRSDFRGRRSAPTQKKAVPSFFRSPKQQKSKPVPAHTLKCDRTVRRRKAREWEITRVRATAPLGGGGTGQGEGLAEGHAEGLGDGQWWSFRAGVVVSQVFITSFKMNKEKANDAGVP